MYVRVLQAAWRLLPDRLLLLPLAYNRLQYEKLVRYHRKDALDSFAPPPGHDGRLPGLRRPLPAGGKARRTAVEDIPDWVCRCRSWCLPR